MVRFLQEDGSLTESLKLRLTSSLESKGFPTLQLCMCHQKFSICFSIVSTAVYPTFIPSCSDIPHRNSDTNKKNKPEKGQGDIGECPDSDVSEPWRSQPQQQEPSGPQDEAQNRGWKTNPMPWAKQARQSTRNVWQTPPGWVIKIRFMSTGVPERSTTCDQQHPSLTIVFASLKLSYINL